MARQSYAVVGRGASPMRARRTGPAVCPGVDRVRCRGHCGLGATRGGVGVPPGGAVGAADDRGGGGARRWLCAVSGRGVLDPLVRLPGNPGRRADAADRDLEHSGNGDRAGPGSDRCRVAVGLDAVLPAAAAQLSARPGQSGCAERVRGHVHLQHGGSVHGRSRGGTTSRGLPAAGCQLCPGHAVRHPADAGVLRAPSGALDPDRRGDEEC